MKKKIVGILVLMLILLASSVLAADIASGTSGTCTWVIDEEGNLVISPTSGEEGTLEDLSYRQPGWVTYASDIKTARFEGTIHAISCNYMFNYCTSMNSVDLTGLDTSNVSNFYAMFRQCESLTTIDASGLNTNQAVYMSSMFEGCSALTTLDVSEWDTSNISELGSMFEGCSALTTLDTSNWVSSNVGSVRKMFAGCKALTSVDLHGFVSNSIYSMDYMFADCEKLEYIDISGFDTTGFDPWWYYGYEGGMYCAFVGLPSLQTLIIGDGFVLPNTELYDVTDIFDEYPEEWHNEDEDEYYLIEELAQGSMGGTYHRTGREFEFVKIDADTKEKITGAKFYLKNAFDEYLVSANPVSFGAEASAIIFTTDENGKFTTPKLNRGRYFICEKEAADGYQNNSYVYLIDFTHNEMITKMLESEDDYELEAITSENYEEKSSRELTEEDKTNLYQVNSTYSDAGMAELYEKVEWDEIDAGKAYICLTFTRNWTRENSTLEMVLSPRFRVSSINVPDEVTYTLQDRKVSFDLSETFDGQEYIIEIEVEVQKLAHDGEWFRVHERNVTLKESGEYDVMVESVSSPKLAERRAIYSGDELEQDNDGAFIITNQKLEEPISTPTPTPTPTRPRPSSGGGSSSTPRGKVIVKYMNQTTGAVIEEVTLRGKVGSDYETEEKEIEGYTLVGSTQNTTGEFEREDIEVIYYYIDSNEAPLGEEPSGEEPPVEEPPVEEPPVETPKYHFTLRKEDAGHHEWYVRGYEDYTFRIDKSMTREEIATIFYRLTVVPEGDIRQSFEVSQNPFEDVDKDRWSARPIAYMKMLGLMNGYPDGRFDPTRPITRAEFAQVIGKFADIATSNTTKTFQDIEDDYWAKNAIQLAQEQGWIQGYEDGSFKPNKNISRVEIVTIVNRMLHRKLNTFYLDKVKIPVVDLDPNHWGYADIVEAIIEYDYELNEDGEENILRYRYPFHENMGDEAYNDV